MINELKSHYIHFSLLLFVIIVLLQFNFFLFNIQSYKNTDLNKKEIEGIVVLTGDKFRILEGLKILNSEIGYKLLISGVNKEISIEEIKKEFQKINIRMKKLIVEYVKYLRTKISLGVGL